MLNGLLTARLGLLAIDVTRPLPFHELPRPALNDLAGSAACGRRKPGRTDLTGLAGCPQDETIMAESRLFLALPGARPLYARHLTRGPWP